MPVRNASDKDYYTILGIARDATDEDIKRAYRRLAFQCHPDRNPGNPNAGERFKEISEAYAVLIDPDKRQRFDQARQSGRPGDFSFSRQDIFSDLFTNPGASAVFEDLAREFERMGMRVDRHFCRKTKTTIVTRTIARMRVISTS